jgi:hypothetical protein
MKNNEELKNQHRSVDNPHAEHLDEDSIDIDLTSKDYPTLEHLSNARLMPMTGPYGGLDLLDTYEYGSVPEDPGTPLESYEILTDKNSKRD